MTAQPMSIASSYASNKAWKNKSHPKDAAGVPWLIRPINGKIELKIPYAPLNRQWLKSGFGSGASLREKLNTSTNSWLVSRAHFRLAALAMADRCGQVQLYMHFKDTMRCNSSCQGAKKEECVCSCLGHGHGGGIAPTSGWEVRGSRILIGGIVEVHSTLIRDHSLDGMFL